MAQKKMRLPFAICELLRWRLDGNMLSGEVFRIREKTEPYNLTEGMVRVFKIEYMVHYPKGYDEDEYYYARLAAPDVNYVKCFVSEKEEWPEALKVLLSKPPEDPA